MPGQLLLDRIEGQRERWDATGLVSATRVAYVKGAGVFGTHAAADPFAIVRAKGVPGMPVPQVSAHPCDPGCILKEIEGGALNGANDTFRFELHYERPERSGGPFVGAPIGATFIRESTSLVEVTRSVVPIDGARKAVRVNWKNPNNAADEITDAVPLRYLMPVRTLTVNATVRGEHEPLIAAARAAAGCVNDRDWVGKPAGYWLCVGMEFDVATYDVANLANSTFNVSVAFHTKNTEPWLEAGVLFNTKTGRYIDVPDQTLQDARAMTYAHKIEPFADQGFVVVGPYPVRDFASLFGPILLGAGS